MSETAEQKQRRLANSAASSRRAAQPHDVDWDAAIASLHRMLKRVYRRPR